MQGDLRGLQTPPGARSSRNQAARLMIPGRPLRWMVTHVITITGQNPAYRLTHRHEIDPPNLHTKCQVNLVTMALCGRGLDRSPGTGSCHCAHGSRPGEISPRQLDLGDRQKRKDLGRSILNDCRAGNLLQRGPNSSVPCARRSHSGNEPFTRDTCFVSRRGCCWLDIA